MNRRTSLLILLAFEPVVEAGCGERKPGQGAVDAGGDLSDGGSRDERGEVSLDGSGDLSLPVPRMPSFSAAVAYPSGGGMSAAAVSIVLGDLNGDGSLDVVVANHDASATGSGNVAVLLNDGDGVFTAPTVLSASGNPLPIALGDVNGDGRLDLVAGRTSATPEGMGSIAVFLNAGGGTFATPITYEEPGSLFSVALGDLNGDGAIDIAANSKGVGNGIGVRLNDGNGVFSGPVYQYFSGDRGGEAITLGDLNGDGKNDLSVATFLNLVGILMNNGDGTFRGVQAHVEGTFVSVGDVNGDARPDLMVSMPGGYPAVLTVFNDGDDTFTRGYPVRGDRYLANLFPSDNPTIPDTRILRSMALGDLNGDGTLDLAGAGGVVLGVVVNRGDGSFVGAVEIASGADLTSLAIGDLNRDGNNDLAVAGGDHITIVLNAHPALKR
jgi:hypothetical protein